MATIAAMILDMGVVEEEEEDILWQSLVQCSRWGVQDAAAGRGVEPSELLKLKGVFVALANLSLRITGNQLDLVEFRCCCPDVVSMADHPRQRVDPQCMHR